VNKDMVNEQFKKGAAATLLVGLVAYVTAGRRLPQNGRFKSTPLSP
jgi:hypothetical protein